MAKFAHKVVPVVLRRREELEILAFRHPQEGTQLVKGTLENGENADDASLRELAEESGIENAAVVRPLGQLTFQDIAQFWRFFLCRVPGQLPDQWTFFTQDEGGLLFDFFWYNLNKPPDENWHADSRRALTFICTQIQKAGKTL